MNRLALGVALLALFGCPTTPPPPAPAVRLELSPAAVLVPGVGSTATLQVRAFDAKGNAVTPPSVQFTSSTASVTVGADGTLTGAASGTSRITVTAGELSATATALVAQPVAGAVLVSDEQVDGDLRPVDPLAPLDVGYRYEVALKGVTPPAVGGFLIGTGVLPLGGRVVASAGSAVTLEVVPLPDLFPALQLDERLTLKDAPLDLDPAVLETFDVVQTPGGGMQLSLKDGQTLTGSIRKRKTRAPTNGEFEFDLGPVACKVEASAFQLSLAKLEINLDPGLTVERVFDSAHQRVVINSNAKASVTVKPVLQSQLEGKLTCELEIGKRYIPLPGPVGLALGFEVPFGVGFELEAKTPLVAGVSVELKRDVSATSSAGVDCLTACVPVGDFANTSPPFAGVQPPSVNFALPTALKVEASLYAYAFAKLGFGGSQVVQQFGGAVGFRTLAAELIVLKAGAKLDGKFADEAAQAGDAAFSGSYRLLFEGGLEPGKSVETFFRFIKVTAVKLELKLVQELATSPQGTLTVNKQTFVSGDDLQFTVAFTANSLEFPAIGFNAKKVRVYKKTPSLVLVAESAVTAGQNQVTLNAVATQDGSSDSFVGFVETAFLDALSCELSAPFNGPRVTLVATPSPGEGGTAISETTVTGYDCPMDNSIRTELRTDPTMDLPVPFSLTAGGSTLRVEEVRPGVYDLTVDAPGLMGEFSGTCPSGDTYDESSSVSWSVALHVTPMDAGGFITEPDTARVNRFEYNTRMEWNMRQVTGVALAPSPMRNAFPAGKTFALTVSGLSTVRDLRATRRLFSLSFVP